jgi:hypothetical protein
VIPGRGTEVLWGGHRPHGFRRKALLPAGNLAQLPQSGLRDAARQDLPAEGPAGILIPAFSEKKFQRLPDLASRNPWKMSVAASIRSGPNPKQSNKTHTMKRKIMMALLICASALTLSGTVYAEEKTDLSGKYFIQIAGKVGNGQDLHHGPDARAVTLDHSNVPAWEIKKVEVDGRDDVYTIAQSGKSFLSVKDGKAVCGDYKGKWVVLSNGPGKFSILWTEDDQKGGNALSIISDKPVDLGHDNVSYDTTIARNNAGGKGMDHQIWNLVPEAEGGAAARKRAAKK